ncbi:MAG: GAF domain-containing sensor histidine kinase [Actinomycetota bacterium]|nr:GAF domain-containing sensor histidine kinase [Actinomycetota bacterium]
MERGHPRDRQAALLEAGLALSSQVELPAVLQRIVELAVEITGARYGALGVLGPDGRIREFLTVGVSEGQRAAIGHLPVGRGILGVLIADARPLRLADIHDDSRSVGFPANHPPMKSFLGAPVKARGRVFGNIYLTQKQGAEQFSEQDQEDVVVLATQAGVAIENARLYEEARQRERRLEAVREVATAILAGTDQEAVLELIARRARELVGAALSTIATPDDGDTLVIHVADGDGADALRGMSFPVEASVSGEVIRSGEAVLLEDASADPRIFQPVVRTGRIGPAMFVPLSIRDRTFGTLLVANHPSGRVFDQEDLDVIRTFGDQAVLALEYTRVQRELHRLAVLEDRERIAKELHDGVIQALFAVGMGLQGTAGLVRDAELESRIEGAVAEIDRVIRDLRNYIFGLRPGILADRQLDQAIRHLAVEFQDRTGVVTVVDIDPEVASEITGKAGDVIQLVREALSNVGKHAEATTCRVSLHRGEGGAVLEIDDDGRGFDPRAADGAGLGQGLPNLRGRTEALGGKMELLSAPDEGTTVRVLLPP